MNILEYGSFYFVCGHFIHNIPAGRIFTHPGKTKNLQKSMFFQVFGPREPCKKLANIRGYLHADSQPLGRPGGRVMTIFVTRKIFFYNFFKKIFFVVFDVFCS